jgi:nitric oxide reductase NorD protein
MAGSDERSSSSPSSRRSGDDRAASFFVRALLFRDLPVRIAAPGVTRAHGDARGLHLPAAFPMYGPGSLLARRARFASAAHLAAHVRFGHDRLARGALRPIQIVLVSLFEDARVERLAARELPGLGGLWALFHSALPTDLATFPALCARLARALLVPSYLDPHPIIARARTLFFHPDHDLGSAAGSRRAGSLLGNDVGQMRLSFNAKEYVVEPPYRDDHQLLWEEPRDQPATSFEDALEIERVSSAAAISSGDAPARAGGPAPPARDESAGLARAAPPLTADPADRAPARGSVTYPEWDHRIGASRPDWCTVLESPGAAWAQGMPLAPRAGPPPALDAEVRARAAWLARRLRVEDLIVRRRERDGDAPDLDAAIAALVDRRVGGASEPRVYSRAARRRRDLAVLLLLDLSASTGDPVPAPAGHTAERTGERIIDLEAQAAALLADVLARTGDQFAVHGFSSNGRHQVEYQRLKDLGDSWDPQTQTRLGAMVPRLSTRMGAALRHAGRCLRQVRSDRRLILLLTDGQPCDVDAPDPAYLLEDARHAVAEQRRRGIHVFGISLDAGGDAYVRRIFGEGGYCIVDRITRLPDTLPRLYARLAR